MLLSINQLYNSTMLTALHSQKAVTEEEEEEKEKEEEEVEEDEEEKEEEDEKEIRHMSLILQFKLETQMEPDK